MSEPDITNLVRIQPEPEYWYTVEDYHLDVGCDGLTISYWETRDGREQRIDHMCMNKESAIAVGDAIHRLFKKTNSNDWN